MGCHLMSELHGDKFVGGEKLYNPDPFEWGSSLSHVDNRGLIYAGIPCCQCLDFDAASYSILNELGANCVSSTPIGVTSGASDTSLWGIYICLILCIKWVLRI